MSNLLKFVGDLFKKYFTAGLFAILPIAGTVWLIKAIIFFFQDVVNALIPEGLRPSRLWGAPGVEIIFSIVFILAVGILTRLYAGKKLMQLGDRVMARIPFARTIYNAIKQLLNVLTHTQSRGKDFKRVALVVWPRPGCYTIGFVTGEAAGDIQAKTPGKVFYVFVPTTPNPTSGYLLVVKEDELIPIDMSVEEAFRTVISGGTAAPTIG